MNEFSTRIIENVNIHKLHTFSSKNMARRRFSRESRYMGLMLQCGIEPHDKNNHIIS